MKMSLNNLGDVQELTALPVWEWTEKTIPGRREGKLSDHLQLARICFVQK